MIQNFQFRVEVEYMIVQSLAPAKTELMSRNSNLN